MKAKSMKLRFLVVLHALYKYTDKNHRMNTPRLNEYLKPFGLEFQGGRSLGDTVRIMREFGIDVRHNGEWDHQGVWIADRPLNDADLNALVFAVSTNPYLSNEQATEILSSLRPLVTFYQEPALRSNVQTGAISKGNQSVYDTYMTLSEAIRLNRRVRYTRVRVRYDKETGEVFEEREWKKLFTPKCLYQTAKHIYAVGYVHPNRCVQAVDLEDMLDVSFSFKHNDPNAEKVKTILDEIDPQDYIPEERRQLIYKGPGEFKCRGQFIEELYNRFGQPSEPFSKDKRCRSVYRVAEVEIWPETLLWFSQAPEHGIRIVGPEALVEAVRDYYSCASDALLDPYIPANKNRHGQSS